LSNLVYPHSAPSQPAPRRHARELQRIVHHGQAETHKITEIHHAARRSMFETMQTGMARRAAELAVPDQADLLQAINLAAGFATVNIISGMGLISMSLVATLWFIAGAAVAAAAIGSGLTLALVLYSSRIRALLSIAPALSAADQIAAVHQAARDAMWAAVQQRMQQPVPPHVVDGQWRERPR
jgi:hypothetical protein